MRRRSKASSKLAKARSRKAKTLKAVRHTSSSASGQETAVVRLARELSAMSEILRLISNSPSNVTAILQSVAEQAAQICQAQYVDILIVENDSLRNLAWFGEIKRTLAFPLDRSSVAGRSVCDMRPISVDDLQNAGDEFARGREIARKDGHRSTLGVPLIREGRAIGTIIIRRMEIRPFEQKHISLLTTFAAQAVIAIENARLLNELRQSLEQQTATADVLGVISSSPGALEPVFDALLEKATRLCEAKFGNLFLRRENGFQHVAMHGAPSAYMALGKALVVLSEHPYSPLAEAVRTKQTVHVTDMSAHQSYLKQDERIVALVDAAGARTLLTVPMLKDDDPVGAIVIYRQEARAFTDKQIALVQNFAAQAVIAIENTRLLNELRESLERQTATSEVLGVISSSPGELTPVFEAMLDNAVRICEAKFGNLFLYEGGAFRLVATKNAPPGFARHDFVVEDRSRVPLARLARAKQVIHIVDLTTDPGYLDGDPRLVSLVEFGARTMLLVPMLKENQLAGTVVI
jgi:GAF domain-containing protein